MKAAEHLSSESAIEYAQAKRNDTMKHDIIMTKWTEKLFTIVDAHRSDPPVYRLVDWHGDQLDGTFYEPELHEKVIVPKGKTLSS